MAVQQGAPSNASGRAHATLQLLELLLEGVPRAAPASQTSPPPLWALLAMTLTLMLAEARLMLPLQLLRLAPSCELERLVAASLRVGVEIESASERDAIPPVRLGC